MNLEPLRAHAVGWTFFGPLSLKAAIRRLGFVQADPIRAPARAQDLILRQRVDDYRAGDLERKYASLDIEEDLLYAYGFLPRPVWQLLHPRRTKRMTQLEERVLAVVREAGAVHPNELEAHFGKKRVINAWGGYSKATKHALEHLHYRGLLRIARRESGIRIYEPTPPTGKLLSAKERLRKLVLVVAGVLAPVQEKTLTAIASRLHRRVPGSGTSRATVRTLIGGGELQREIVDGISYLWPPAPVEDLPDRVRILAPFDPLVWDRSRFEHLWNWQYRFEAYTPIAKRVRGYYAMPLLWRECVIGWANADSTKIDFGFNGKRPTDRSFSRELDAEVDRLRRFLR